MKLIKQTKKYFPPKNRNLTQCPLWRLNDQRKQIATGSKIYISHFKQ